MLRTHPILLVTLTIIFTLPNIGFAQNTSNSTQVNDKEVKLISPVLQKVSEKGTYLVAIKSGQSSLSTGLNIELVFLNKISPYLNAPPPNSESNFSSTEYAKSSGIVIPSLIERTMPVKCYDIIVYSSDGKELWKKTGQSPQGGRAPQIIMIKDYNIGDITISIKNIIPDPALADMLLKQNGNNSNALLVLNQSASKESPTDSVEFQTKIVVI